MQDSHTFSSRIKLSGELWTKLLKFHLTYHPGIFVAQSLYPLYLWVKQQLPTFKIFWHDLVQIIQTLVGSEPGISWTAGGCTNRYAKFLFHSTALRLISLSVLTVEKVIIDIPSACLNCWIPWYCYSLILLTCLDWIIFLFLNPPRMHKPDT